MGRDVGLREKRRSQTEEEERKSQAEEEPQAEEGEVSAEVSQEKASQKDQEDRQVREAERLIENGATIAVVAQDSVPEYLDLSTGRLMRKPDDVPNQDDIILTWCPSS